MLQLNNLPGQNPFNYCTVTLAPSIDNSEISSGPTGGGTCMQCAGWNSVKRDVRVQQQAESKSIFCGSGYG